MPFTLAHPLAVFPFRKTRLDMTCLVIGSMAPDFDYLFRTQIGTLISHSPNGIIRYCIPVTLGAACVWHFIIKSSLASALPRSLALKYSDWLTNSWEYKSLFRLFIILFSAFVGIITHLVWDSFTHSSGYFVQNISFLTERTFIYQIPIFKLLQYGCGILGAVTVLFVVILHISEKPLLVVPRHPKSFWITALFVLVVFCIARSFTLPHVSFVRLLRYTIVNFLSGSAVSITVASVVVRIYDRFRTSSKTYTK
ncbi:MAG: DUF4184 family protein [Ignavibacteriales bacterium]|nr:DUF4184 family protein [Ignavibacteriales bacterium]